MNKTLLSSVSIALLGSAMLHGCDDKSPMGVPDEVPAQEEQSEWSKDMVDKAQTEIRAPENVDREYRPSEQEPTDSPWAKSMADKATGEEEAAANSEETEDQTTDSDAKPGR